MAITDPSTFLTSSPGASSVLPPEFGALITGPLKETAIAFDPRVSTTITTSLHSYRAPLEKSGGTAQWVAEGEEIPLSKPTLDEIAIIPTKVAGLRSMSRELVEDSDPSAQELVGRDLARSLVEQVDTAFFGAGDENNLSMPKGLGSVAAATIATGALTSLDLIHDAKAAAESAGAKPTALIAHPLDVLKLVKLKTADGSNQSLLVDSTVVAGVPIISTAYATQGEPWLVDAEAIVTVLREDASLAISDSAQFSSDRIAMRGTIRVGFGFVHPEALVKIMIAEPGA